MSRVESPSGSSIQAMRRITNAIRFDLESCFRRLALEGVFDYRSQPKPERTENYLFRMSKDRTSMIATRNALWKDFAFNGRVIITASRDHEPYHDHYDYTNHLAAHFTSFPFKARVTSPRGGHFAPSTYGVLK